MRKHQPKYVPATIEDLKALEGSRATGRGGGQTNELLEQQHGSWRIREPFSPKAEGEFSSQPENCFQPNYQVVG